MPRTKVPKTAKRNRGLASREEKIHQYEEALEQYCVINEANTNKFLLEIDSKIDLLVRRANSALLNMKVDDFLQLNLSKLSDFNTTNTLSILPTHNNTLGKKDLLNSTKIINQNDEEGYFTEDSTNGYASSNSSTLSAFVSGVTQAYRPLMQHGRTPGPLSSARERKSRRSRSAGGAYVPSLQSIPSSAKAMNPGNIANNRVSRNKFRTPTVQRTKAFSADRTSKVINDQLPPPSPPTALMRWAKPGELVVSKCGSPLVAQIMPDKFANVNIPIKDGMLSLQPKKLLQDIKSDLIDAIDPDTLDQLKVLHGNLSLIMKMANK